MIKACYIKFFRVFVFTQLLIVFCNAQTNKPSLTNVSVTNNFDSLESIASQQKSNPKALLNTLISLEYSKSIWASSKFATELKRIDSLNKLVGGDFEKAMYFTFLGWQKYRSQAFKDEGYINYMKALKLFENLRDTTGMVYCYFYLFNQNFVYYDNFELNKKVIIDYYNKICNLSVQSKTSFNTLLMLSAKCEYYNRVEINKDNFFKATEDAINFIDQNPQFIYFKTPQLLKLAFYYYENNSLNKTVETLTEALKLSSFKTSLNKSYCQNALAEIFVAMNKTDSAIFWLKKTLQTIYENGSTDLSLLSSVYKRMAVQKRLVNQNDSAWMYNEKSDSILSVYNKIQHNELFTDLQTKYETEKKEEANRVLLNKQENYKIAIIIGAVFTLIIVLLLIRMFTQNKKLKQLGFFRDNVFSIISHDLRSPLLALEGLSSQASFLIRNKKTDVLNEVANKVDGSVVQINNLLNNLLVWAKSQNINNKSVKTQFTLATSIENTTKLYADICNAKGISIVQNANANIELFANKNVLELLLRNWIDNTIKHTKATAIDISANSTHNTTQIIIKTNDIVAAEITANIQQQIHYCNTLKLKTSSGLGLSLMCSFAKQEGWSLDFNCNGTDACFFTITIPR